MPLFTLCIVGSDDEAELELIDVEDLKDCNFIDISKQGDDCMGMFHVQAQPAEGSWVT